MGRPACPRCERPTPTCLCAGLPPAVALRTALLILQHPAEAGHAKNTTAFLTQGLAPVSLLRAEAFDAALGTPGTALLYPGVANAPTTAAPGEIRQLVLLDGTWRQSRRLLAANPWLRSLPRLALPAQPSRYAIRRAHRPGQLSTLEAALHALTLLEGAPERFDSLWAAFDAFVQAGLARRGETGLA